MSKADRPIRTEDLKEGMKRLPLVLRARKLKAEGKTWRQIGRDPLITVPWQTVMKWCQMVEHIAGTTELRSADLAPGVRNSGRQRKHRPLTPEEVTAVKKNTGSLTNRTETAGSVPEGLRQAIKKGELAADLVEQITTRADEGKPLLTRAQSHEVRISEVAVRGLRAPREAWLEYVESPGSTLLTIDSLTGKERMLQPGERWTIDDGTINLGCCVDIERPGDKCWEKFRIVVGRFQFLLVVDCRTHYVTGFTYTARPRSSYRAEDLTAAMHNSFMEHGMPVEMLMENGISASELIHRTLDLATIRVIHASSPHQKIVENVFNKLWTKLAALPGQVGRYRGEEQEMGKVMESCRKGETDPRQHFAPLNVVVEKLREAINEHNAQWINSQQYGRWIPGEFFTKDAHQMLRPINPADAWMFSPVVTAPLKVRGFALGTTVQLMPGFSLKFHFSAMDFAADMMGAWVRLHFNPFAPDCVAKAVLAEPFAGKARNAVLGDAVQFNRHARFTRRAFGYGIDPDIGRQLTKAHAQAVRRSSVAIRFDGKRGIEQHVERDGQGNSRTIVRDSDVVSPAPEQRSLSAAIPQPVRKAVEPIEVPWSRRKLMEEVTD